MRIVIAATVALSALLGGCDNGGGGSSNPTPTPDPTPDPTPTFTPKAFTGFMPAFEGDVALAIVSGHAITATRQLDTEGDEKKLQSTCLGQQAGTTGTEEALDSQRNRSEFFDQEKVCPQR